MEGTRYESFKDRKKKYNGQRTAALSAKNAAGRWIVGIYAVACSVGSAAIVAQAEDTNKEAI